MMGRSLLAVLFVMALPGDAKAELPQAPQSVEDVGGSSLDLIPLSEPREDTTSREESEARRFFFYNPDGIGAHAFHTPWGIIVESGLEEYDAQPLSKLQFLKGQQRVIQGLVNPIKSIESYGVEEFFYQQILPLSPLIDGTPAFIPNYLWHFLGGGFRHRMMTEYFTHRGMEYPQLWSWLTLYTGHWLNEVVQAQKFRQGSADAIADLLLFDWIGKLMFLNDDVAEFFADTLHLRDWTFQTSYNPVTNSLYNTGQLMWARLHIYGGLSISALTGHLINSFNLTYSADEDLTQWTLGVGLQARRFEPLPNGDLAPGQMRWCFLAAYSEEDNPLVVVVVKEGFPDIDTLYDASAEDPNTLTDYNFVLAPSVQVNVYPKWLEIGGEKFGLHLSWMQDTVFMGIGHGSLPVGLSLSPPLAERYKDDF
ncbi:MAG: hypothetical protein ACPGU1_17755 [Myxococcota bacterium]